MEKLKKIRIIYLLLNVVLAIIMISLLFIFSPNKKEEESFSCLLRIETNNSFNADQFVGDMFFKGTKIEEFDDFPQKVNQYFDGWYFDKAYSNPVTFPFVLEKDTTLYAKFIDANLPRRNIGFDEELCVYYIKGALLDNTIEVLVIPDIYDDGVHGVKRLEYIENESENSSLLTNNKTVNKVYIGNNINEVTDYFAYNSKSVTDVVFGKNVVEIGANSFKLCENIENVESESFSNWWDLSSENLISIDTTMRQEGMYIIKYVLGVQENELDRFLNETSFKDKRVFISEAVLTEDDQPLPKKVNYYFENWYLDSAYTQKVVFPLNITQEDRTVRIYAKFLKGNVPDECIIYNNETSGYKWQEGFPSGVTSDDNVNDNDPNIFTLVIPDYYDKAGDGYEAMPLNVLRNTGLISDGNKVNVLYISNTIKEVSSYFSSTGNYLKKIVVGREVETIGSDVFGKVSRLEELILYNKLNKIGSLTFDECPHVLDDSKKFVFKIKFYGTVEEFCSIVFSGTCGLFYNDKNDNRTEVKVYINDGLLEGELCVDGVKIGDNLFRGGYFKINKIIIKNTDNIANAIDGFDNEKYEQWGSITSIELYNIGKVYRSFSNHINLKDVKMYGVKDIKYSFGGCSKLESVFFDKELKTITMGIDGFNGCSNLKSVIFEDPTGWTIEGCSLSSEELVPYLSDPVWCAKVLRGVYTSLGGCNVAGGNVEWTKS